jgi:septal ring factor EnvC (AmiA/AmiB activator)
MERLQEVAKGTAELANKLESPLVEQQGLLEATADDRERLAGELAEAGRRAAAAEEAGEEARRRAAAAEEVGTNLYCSLYHPMHCEPSFSQLHDIP